MQQSLLGTLQVSTGEGAPITVRESKVRALLLQLLIADGAPVTVDRLIALLWPTKPPANPVASVHTKVWQLRRTLARADPGAQDLVQSAPSGYCLDRDAVDIDARLFEQMVCRARWDEPEERAQLLTDALALWRGPALADVADDPSAQPTATRLEELRLTALEDRAEAPDHGLPIPESQVPDGRLAQATVVVLEGGVVEPACVRAAKVQGLGDLSDVLDLREMPLVPDGVQSERPARRGSWVGDLHEHVEAQVRACWHELPRPREDEAGQRNIIGGCFQSSPQVVTHFRVREVLSEERITRRPDAVEVEVQAAHGLAADLHGGEVGVACEGQRSQLFRSRWVTVDLGNRDGHAWTVGVDTSVKRKRRAGVAAARR